MRIRIEASTFLTASSYSGVGHYSEQLAKSLQAAGHDVTAAVWPISKPLEEAHNTGRVSSLLSRLYRKLSSFGFAPYFDLFMPAADLTIFPDFAIYPTKKSASNAVVIHDLTYLHFPTMTEKKNLAYLKRSVPRSIANADFIITVSQSVKKELVREFSLDPTKCVVTPIPPDTSFFSINNNEIHRKYGIPTKNYILFLGNFEPRKNLTTLIKAYRLLEPAIKKHYCLVIAGGSGWGSKESQRALRDAQSAGENIVHIGYVNQADVAALYQQSSLFVFPSLYEGFGMPPLEAMASGVPVVVSNIPVLRESAGEGALYFDVQDADGLKERISEVLQNKNVRDSLRRTAHLHLKGFSWKNNVNEIIKQAES